MTIYIDQETRCREYDPKVGDEKILVERKNLNTGNRWYDLRDDNGGIPGNTDHSIRRYHGWRGTTNNYSTTALGLRRIEKVQEFQNRSVRVWLSDDLKPDAE